MTDSLERFLEDLRFEVPAGLAHRAKAAAAGHDRARVSKRHIGRQPPLWALTVTAAVLALAIVATLIFGARLLHPEAPVPANQIPKALIPSDPIPPSVAANGWIAYSTDGRAPGSTDITTGSDIYLVRAGVKPRLIAGRDGGKVRNICPAFSPDGRRMAYGADARDGSALVLLGVNSSGVITATVRFPVPGSGRTVCPRWSADGRRVAYLDGGKVVVRGLDGSTLAGAAGDPRIEDFGLVRQLTDPLLSPQGDRVARLSGKCEIVFAKPDGTTAHVIPLDNNCAYAISAWSPDGRQVLVMEDVSGIDFRIQAIVADSPFDKVTIVSTVRTNGARSWPGWGDVSWQSVLPAMPSGNADLKAGTYAFDFSQLDAGGKPFPKVLITVPDGWSTYDFFVHTQVGMQRQIAVSFWNVVDVYANGCHWLSPPMIHPGPTVADLAAVIAARPLRNATAPVAVTLGGYNGEFLEWSVPTGINFSDCDRNPADMQTYFESWTGAGLSSTATGDRYQQVPGQVDRLWILDVEGRRLVIDAAYWPGSTDQDRAALQHLVDSIVFQP